MEKEGDPALTAQDALNLLYRYAVHYAHPDHETGATDAFFAVQAARTLLQQVLNGLPPVTEADMDRLFRDYFQRKTADFTPTSSPFCSDAAAQTASSPFVSRCLFCGQSFTGHPRARYCSATCRSRAWRSRHPTSPIPSGQRVRKPSPPRRSTCVVCGQVFYGPRKGGRYCSAACSQRAYRARKAAREGDDPPLR